MEAYDFGVITNPSETHLFSAIEKGAVYVTPLKYQWAKTAHLVPGLAHNLCLSCSSRSMGLVHLIYLHLNNKNQPLR